MKPRTHKFKYWRDDHWNEEKPYVTIVLDKVEAYSPRTTQYQETSYANYEPRECLHVRMTGGSEYRLWCTEKEFEKVYLSEEPAKPKEYMIEELPGIICWPKHLRTGNPEDKGEWEVMKQQSLNELCKKVED
jgi:hypothetical protein